MSKKTLFIILGIVALIVIVVLVMSLPKGPEKIPEEVSPPGEEITPQAQTPEERADILTRAINAQDPSLCERILEEGARKSCREYAITAAAGAKGDPTICNQIEEESQRIPCRDYIILNRAIGAKDPSICEKMEDKTRVEECKKVATPLE